MFPPLLFFLKARDAGVLPYVAKHLLAVRKVVLLCRLAVAICGMMMPHSPHRIFWRRVRVPVNGKMVQLAIFGGLGFVVIPMRGNIST
jgi:hypothetical protein